jgi:hypothetical protein
MGEARLKQSATRSSSRSIPHVASALAGVPPRRASTCRPNRSTTHRPDKLVMPACAECNGGTSTADLVAAIVSRWAIENNEQEHQDHEKLSDGCESRHQQ